MKPPLHHEADDVKNLRVATVTAQRQVAGDWLGTHLGNWGRTGKDEPSDGKPEPVRIFLPTHPPRHQAWKCA